jgi:hypothetical protein
MTRAGVPGGAVLEARVGGAAASGATEKKRPKPGGRNDERMTVEWVYTGKNTGLHWFRLLIVVGL